MKAIGIILAGGNDDKLEALTKKRALSAMPIGSCYRAIDFPLSNMTNSGIGKVAVITQYNSRSLQHHLSSSKWWNLGRKQGGLFVLSPYISSENSYWFRGTADSIFQNISYLERSIEPFVVIASGDSVYKINYNKVIEEHIESKSDITIVCKEMDYDDPTGYGVLSLDENNQLIEFEEKPIEAHSSLVSTGIYVISRTLLISLLNTLIPEARYDIVNDIIIRYRKKLKISGYKFDGYWKSIKSVKSYYELNMDFLDANVRNLFTKDSPYISTVPRDLPPAKYNQLSSVKNSLVGSGCIINGTIENSIIFRKIFTAENSHIKNSIIMESCYIGNDCIVENAILDKEVVVSDGKHIIGTKEKPIIVSKGSVF
jgi:glucose-1-phosphate adenylyltransferase